MIVYLNNRKYIEEQREFGLGNFFKNIGSVFSRKPATAPTPSSVVTGRVKRGGDKVLNTAGVTPVVPGTKPKPKETVSNNTQQTNNAQQPANQPANTQQANNTQQQPANTQQQQQPANNTQSTNTGQNNNTTTNNNSKTENKPNWWNRWGKTTAKVTAGVGAVGTLGAGVYGLHEMHKMTSSDDR